MIKKTLVLFLYLVFIIYSLEILTTVFLIKKNTVINVSNKREILAKKFDIEIDNRPYIKVFSELVKTNDLRHEFRLNISSLDAYKSVLTNLKFIPLKGPINSNSLGQYSNENGNYKIYKNDKYGFRNDNKIYDKKIINLIIGDSFAEGLPLEQNKNVSSILIDKFDLNTANFGIAGTSLISYYAVFKEYAKQIKPENVILFYYEGNDFLMLNSEKNSFLSKYLKENFTQNLIKKNYEVNKSLKILENYTQDKYSILMEKEIQKEKNLFNKEKMIDFLEIQNLRSILNIDLSVPDYSMETNLFKTIIRNINEQTQEWGGELILVYVPSWGRYNDKYKFEGNNAKYIFNLKNLLINYLKESSIKYIDLDKEFTKSNNPSKYYNFDFYGHFNDEGYMLLSELINSKLN